MPATSDARAGRAAFTHPGFVLFQVARFLIVAAVEMQAVAVGWQVYEITKSPLDLGYVGLAQFLPAILLFPISGHASDRFERRNVLSACYAGYAVCFALLLALAQRGVPSIKSIYVVLVLIGVVRSFNSTASRSILPQLVPEEHFPNAVAWNASIFQAATILGPSFGGILYAAFKGPSVVYVVAMVTAIGATLSSFRIRPEVKARPREPMSLKTVFAGLHYIWQKKLILGAISLDLFAVLLGGAVALLPVYAREILHTGPWGLGLLRTAPGVGAAIMAVMVRADAAVVGGGIWNLHDYLRALAQSGPLAGCVVAARGKRHDQRDNSSNAHATCDSGCDAWARDGGRYDFYWDFQ
jgi:MFS family permease